MTSRQQGWYWIGLGVLGLGISSNPATNPGQWVSDITDRAAMMTTQASDELVAYVDCARKQAVFARVEAAKIRMIDVRIPDVKVICPRQHIVVDVPQISISTDGN